MSTACIVYDCIAVGTLSVFSSITINGVLNVPGEIVTGGIVVNGSLFADEIGASSIIVDNIDILGNTCFKGPITCTPTLLITPTSSSTTIILDASTSGFTIDAANNPSDTYIVSIGSNINTGNYWDVYVNSNIQVIFSNDSGRTIIRTGFATIGGSTIFLPPESFPPEVTVVEPGIHIFYHIVFTEVTDTIVKAVTTLIFT
jgi:hypothetical protein